MFLQSVSKGKVLYAVEIIILKDGHMFIQTEEVDTSVIKRQQDEPD